ncbi:MAG: tetratricopeptide repeat protein, partial [bacterium]
LVYVLFGNVTFGLASALLFAVHPVHTEAVAWISGRADVLVTLWSLVSLSCYVLSRRHRSYPLLAASLLAASLFAFALALFSKETAMCLPLLILLLEFGPFGDLLVERRAGRRASTDGSSVNKPARSLVGPSLFMCVLASYLWSRWEAIGTISTVHRAYAPGASGRMALPLSIFAGYVQRLLLPVKLSAEYDAPVPSSFADPHVAAGIVLAALFLWGLWRYRRRAEVVIGASIFVLGLIPVLNIVPIGDVSAERLLYFPSVGAAMIAGGVFATALEAAFGRLRRAGARVRPGLWIGAGRFPRQFAIVFGIILLTFAAKTIDRNRDWKNETVLFAKTIEQEPKSPRAHAAAAEAAERSGDVPKAVREYQVALDLKPDYYAALVGLGQIYAYEGRYDDAVELIERAVTVTPGDSKMMSNLGFLYLHTNQLEKAERWLVQAIHVNPNEHRAHFNLGLVGIRQGRFAFARTHFERAIEGGDEFNMANFHLAMIEKISGNTTLAAKYARTFLASYKNDDRYRREAEAIAGREQ